MKSPNYQSNQPQLYPCVICQKLTDQTCSLCRKFFYCSPQHQQIDWHLNHKMECQGKIMNNINPKINQIDPSTYSTKIQASNRDLFFYDTQNLQNKNNQIRLENQAKKFMQIFEQRLIQRRKILEKLLNLNEYASQINIENLIDSCKQLIKIGETINAIYKKKISSILLETYGVTTNQFILKLDQILDKTLLARCQQKFKKHSEVRKFLFEINNQIPQYPENQGQKYRQIFENVLKSIINLSQVQCNDKLTEIILSRFVKLIQKFDGNWEQIYGYFNMGNWYNKKTYFQKAIKCYNHTLELIKNVKNLQTNENTNLIKSDVFFNLSICQHSLNDEEISVQLMQQSYRLRVKSVGKNSIEASECLECLSKWSFKKKNWQDCLHYAQQCYRVRKLNVNYLTELKKIEILLEEIYTELQKQKQKQKNEQQMKKRPIKYYQTLINPNFSKEQSYFHHQPQQSFIKQLNSIQKEQQIPFKVITTPEMFESYSLGQITKLTKLLEYTDKLMEKEEYRKIIFENDFFESLNEKQRNIYIKMNRID